MSGNPGAAPGRVPAPAPSGQVPGSGDQPPRTAGGAAAQGVDVVSLQAQVAELRAALAAARDEAAHAHADAGAARPQQVPPELAGLLQRLSAAAQGALNRMPPMQADLPRGLAPSFYDNDGAGARGDGGGDVSQMQVTFDMLVEALGRSDLATVVAEAITQQAKCATLDRGAARTRELQAPLLQTTTPAPPGSAPTSPTAPTADSAQQQGEVEAGAGDDGVLTNTNVLRIVMEMSEAQAARFAGLVSRLRAFQDAVAREPGVADAGEAHRCLDELARMLRRGAAGCSGVKSLVIVVAGYQSKGKSTLLDCILCVPLGQCGNTGVHATTLRPIVYSMRRGNVPAPRFTLRASRDAEESSAQTFDSAQELAAAVRRLFDAGAAAAGQAGGVTADALFVDIEHPNPPFEGVVVDCPGFTPQLRDAAAREKRRQALLALQTELERGSEESFVIAVEGPHDLENEQPLYVRDFLLAEQPDAPDLRRLVRGRIMPVYTHQDRWYHVTPPAASENAHSATAYASALGPPAGEHDTDRLAAYHREWMAQYEPMVANGDVMGVAHFVLNRGVRDVYDASQRLGLDDATVTRLVAELTAHNDTQLVAAFDAACQDARVAAAVQHGMGRLGMAARNQSVAALSARHGVRALRDEIIRRRNASIARAVQRMVGYIDGAAAIAASWGDAAGRAASSEPADVVDAVRAAFSRFWSAWTQVMTGNRGNTDLAYVLFDLAPQQDPAVLEAFHDFPYGMTQYPSNLPSERGTALRDALHLLGQLGPEPNAASPATGARVAPAGGAAAMPAPGATHSQRGAAPAAPASTTAPREPLELTMAAVINRAVRAAHMDRAVAHNGQRAFVHLVQWILHHCTCVHLTGICYAQVESRSGHEDVGATRTETAKAIRSVVSDIARAFYERFFQYIRVALLVYLTLMVDCSLYTARTVSETAVGGHGSPARAADVVPVLLQHETALGIFRGLLVRGVALWVDHIIEDLEAGLRMVPDQPQRMVALSVCTQQAIMASSPANGWLADSLRDVPAPAAAGGTPAPVPAAAPAALATNSTATAAMATMLRVLQRDNPVDHVFANADENHEEWRRQVLEYAKCCFSALHVYMQQHVQRVLTSDVYPHLQPQLGRGSLARRLEHHVSACVARLRYFAVDAPLEHPPTTILVVQPMDHRELVRYLSTVYCWDAVRGRTRELVGRLQAAAGVLHAQGVSRPGHSAGQRRSHRTDAPRTRAAASESDDSEADDSEQDVVMGQEESSGAHGAAADRRGAAAGDTTNSVASSSRNRVRASRGGPRTGATGDAGGGSWFGSLGFLAR
jgi:hypothetical protein